MPPRHLASPETPPQPHPEEQESSCSEHTRVRSQELFIEHLLGQHRGTLVCVGGAGRALSPAAEMRRHWEEGAGRSSLLWGHRAPSVLSVYSLTSSPLSRCAGLGSLRSSEKEKSGAAAGCTMSTGKSPERPPAEPNCQPGRHAGTAPYPLPLRPQSRLSPPSPLPRPHPHPRATLPRQRPACPRRDLAPDRWPAAA